MKLLLGAFLSLLLFGTPVVANDAISWQDTDRYVGETRTVEGKVVTARREGNVVRLMFDADPGHFSVALIASLLSPLPSDPAPVYEERTIRVTGKIRRFHGVSEMMIRDPSQITIVPVVVEPSPTEGVRLDKRVEDLEHRVERLERQIKR
jgi:DNA/RNA endonuclease YhcR with UshA esterase domain